MSKWAKPNDLITKLNGLEKRVTNREFIVAYEPDSRPGPIQNTTLEFKVREAKTHLEYLGRVTWDAIPPNECSADLRHYLAEIRPCTAAGTPLDEGHVRRDWVPADNDPSETRSATFTHLEHPGKWHWQARVRAVDKADNLGVWSAWTTPIIPASSGAGPLPPAPNNLSMDFTRHHGHHHHLLGADCSFTAIGFWDVPPTNDNHSSQDQDREDDIDHYVVEMQRCDPLTVQNATTNRYTQIGAMRRRTIHDKDIDRPSDDAWNGTTGTVHFHHVTRKHWYQTRVRSVDRYNRRGTWSNWTAPAKAGDVTAPPAPTTLLFTIHGTKMHLEWDAARLLADDEPDPTLKELRDDIAYFQCQVAYDPTFGSTVLKRDEYVHGFTKTFDFNYAEGTYFARVRSVDGAGNRSAWVSRSQAAKAGGGVPPPAPLNAPVLTFDKIERRKHSPLRAIANYQYPEAQSQVPLIHYTIELWHSENAQFNDDDATRLHHRDADLNTKAVFKGIKRRDWYKARFRVLGGDGAHSDWSPWCAKVQATGSPIPSPPTNVKAITNYRRVGLRWDDPPERSYLADGTLDPNTDQEQEQIIGYNVVIQEGGSLTSGLGNNRRTDFVRGNEKHFTAKQNVDYWVYVQAVDDLRQVSAYTPPGSYDSIDGTFISGTGQNPVQSDNHLPVGNNQDSSNRIDLHGTGGAVAAPSTGKASIFYRSDLNPNEIHFVDNAGHLLRLVLSASTDGKYISVQGTSP